MSSEGHESKLDNRFRRRDIGIAYKLGDACRSPISHSISQRTLSGGVGRIHDFCEFRYTGRPYLCHSFRYKLFVPQSQGMSSHDVPASDLTNVRKCEMVDQKIFKTAKLFGFDSVYFDECTLEMLAKYITYLRPLLNPICEYVLVNRNGKQFQKHSVLMFEAIGKYIHPTRYRQIMETENCQFLLPNEQKWISEDQKHSSNVARVHYQKKHSREVAMRGR